MTKMLNPKPLDTNCSIWESSNPTEPLTMVMGAKAPAAYTGKTVTLAGVRKKGILVTLNGKKMTVLPEQLEPQIKVDFTQATNALQELLTTVKDLLALKKVGHFFNDGASDQIGRGQVCLQEEYKERYQKLISEQDKYRSCYNPKHNYHTRVIRLLSHPSFNTMSSAMYSISLGSRIFTDMITQLKKAPNVILTELTLLNSGTIPKNFIEEPFPYEQMLRNFISGPPTRERNPVIFRPGKLAEINIKDNPNHGALVIIHQCHSNYGDYLVEVTTIRRSNRIRLWVRPEGLRLVNSSDPPNTSKQNQGFFKQKATEPNQELRRSSSTT